MAQNPHSDWLYGPRFDLGLTVGVLALALILGGVASINPVLFGWVLFFDLWLLAYPHVASTYTRVAFDRHSARNHWFLLAGLPPLVLLATGSAAFLGGALVLNTVYFYWQTWHYTRQSYGIARAYRRAGGGDPTGHDWLGDGIIFGFPLWGLLHRASEQSPVFYDTPLWSPQVPHAVVFIVGLGALLTLAAWTLRQLQVVQLGPRRLGQFLGQFLGPPAGTGHALFTLSHVTITAVSYLLIPDITRGWIFINIWHNTQYLLFVWAINARRFRGGIDPQRPFLSRLCQPGQAARYALVCAALGIGFYWTLGQITGRGAWQVLPIVLVCHQAVNFHHYLVDAVIWRSPRPPS